MDTDKILVKQILNGKTELFTELVNRYYSKITSFIMKMNVNGEDAKDLAQDVFIKVYNNLYKYDDRWQFSTWIFKIAINTLRDSKKRKQIKSEELDDYSLESKTFLPEEQLENLYQKELLRKMLKSLDEDVKAMIILRFYNELSFKEIGEIFRKSPDSIKMKVLRARKKLCKTYGNILEGGEYYEM